MPISLPGEHLSLRIKASCTPLAEIAASTLPVTVGGMSRRRATQGNTDHPMALVSGGTTGLPQGSEPASASSTPGAHPQLSLPRGRPHSPHPEGNPPSTARFRAWSTFSNTLGTPGSASTRAAPAQTQLGRAEASPVLLSTAGADHRTLDLGSKRILPPTTAEISPEAWWALPSH